MRASAPQLTLKATQDFWLIKFSRRVTDEHHFCNGSLLPDLQLLRVLSSSRRVDVSYDLKNKATTTLINRAKRILIHIYCSTLQGEFNSVARGFARACHNAASRLPKLSGSAPCLHASEPPASMAASDSLLPSFKVHNFSPTQDSISPASASSARWTGKSFLSKY